MDRTATIAKLAKCQHNPIRDLKVLEAFSDAGLEALEAHCTSQSEAFSALEDRAETAEGELKTLQEKVGSTDATIKTLQADLKKAQKPVSEEDWMKTAPASIRSMVERQQKLDDEKKANLVETLKTAQEEYSEDELKVMELSALERTARILKLDRPEPTDFSAARRVPEQRSAGANDPYLNPPNPYAKALDKNKAAN